MYPGYGILLVWWSGVLCVFLRLKNLITCYEWSDPTQNSDFAAAIEIDSIHSGDAAHAQSGSSIIMPLPPCIRKGQVRSYRKSAKRIVTNY